MSNTETSQTLEKDAVAVSADVSTQTESVQDPTTMAAPADSSASAEKAESKVSEDSVADKSKPPAAKVNVIEAERELVEAAPPKEIALPDTPEIRRILKVQVPIIVRLAQKIMPLGEIMQLGPGAIIEFSKLVNEDLDLMINNKYIGSGQAVKVGEKFGMKITHLVNIDQVICAMGSK